MAGLTVAALAIPSAMAYAELAGRSPVNGLYAPILPGVLHVLLGSSRQLVVGPEGTLATLAAAAVLPLAAAGGAAAAELAAMLALMVAACFLLASAAVVAAAVGLRRETGPLGNVRRKRRASPGRIEPHHAKRAPPA